MNLRARRFLRKSCAPGSAHHRVKAALVALLSKAPEELFVGLTRARNHRSKARARSPRSPRRPRRPRNTRGRDGRACRGVAISNGETGAGGCSTGSGSRSRSRSRMWRKGSGKALQRLWGERNNKKSAHLADVQGADGK